MTVTVTAPLPTPANVVATPKAGGSLDPNTTYYVRIVALSTTSWYYTGTKESGPSTEISFNTTAANKQCDLTWDASAGAGGYYIYLTKTSGVYTTAVSPRIVGAGGGWSFPTATNAYTITGAESMSYPVHPFASAQTMPGSLDKEVGRIHVSYTGTTTLQDIYDQIVADGYGSNVFYDGGTFILNGDIYLTGTTTASLSAYRKIIAFIRGGIRNQNVNSTMTFGLYQATYKFGYHGCVFYFFPGGTRAFVYSHNVDLSGCVIKAEGLGIIPETFIFGSDHYLYATNDTFLVRDVRCEIYMNDYFGATDVKVTDYKPYLTYAGTLVVTRPDVRGAYLGLFGALTQDQKVVDPTVYGGSYDLRVIRSGGYETLIVNGDFPRRSDNIPIIWWSSAASHDDVGLYYGIDLTVVDNNGDAIVGATVTIEDKDGNAISESPLTTDADGSIAVDEIKGYKLTYPGSTGYASTKTDYTPHTVTISKAGYKTCTAKYAMDRKRVEIEMLETQDIAAPTFAGVASATNCETSGEVELAWAAASDAGTGVAGYNIYYHTENDAAAIVAQGVRQVAPAGVTGAVVGGLTDGTLYYFIVRAYDAECPSNEDTNEAIESARPSPGTPVEEVITCDVTEDVITGDVVEETIIGDVVEDAITLDVTEDLITGDIAEDAIVGDMSD